MVGAADRSLSYLQEDLSILVHLHFTMSVRKVLSSEVVTASTLATSIAELPLPSVKSKIS